MIEQDATDDLPPMNTRNERKTLAASWGPPSNKKDESRRLLKDILDRECITTVFQPLFDLRTSEVFAYEALSRVEGPSRFPGPEELFQTAQKLGLTPRLETLCRKRALARARELGIENQLTLNVCPSVLLSTDSENGLSDLLNDLMGLKKHLILELTERFYISDRKAFHRVMDVYRRHGFRVAIDDLGSGFTGLKMLAELEPYLVKVDRYLIADLHRSSKKRLLLEAIVSFCHKINAHVVAEGVEKPEELHDICAMGVDMGQGFYLARPNREPVGCNPQARAQIKSLQRKPFRTVENPNAIGSLAEFVSPVHSNSSTEKLIDRFRESKEATAIPVLDVKRPVGIVHESKLFARLGQRFGYSLFSRKEVSTIMEPVLIFDANTALEEVSKKALRREESAIYDSVVVIQNGLYIGIVTMHRLYERITEQKILLASQANPLTGLPGNNLVKEEIIRRLENKDLFAVIYVDLDNFKPFNDHHGFAQGDAVIRLLGDLLTRCTKEWDFRGFVGHIGGDDFVVACRAKGVETLCETILDRFDEEIKSFHDAETVRRGYYEGVDRQGKRRRFSLLSLSLAVVSTHARVIISYGQLVSIASEVKKKAKQTAGSSYFVDRRHD